MTRTKTYKLGEWAIGGIIKINIIGKVVQIMALDWYTKEVVSHGTVTTDDCEWRHKCETYLENLSTCYHSDKMMKWINKTVK